MLFTEHLHTFFLFKIFSASRAEQCKAAGVVVTTSCFPSPDQNLLKSIHAWFSISSYRPLWLVFVTHGALLPCFLPLRVLWCCVLPTEHVITLWHESSLSFNQTRSALIVCVMDSFVKPGEFYCAIISELSCMLTWKTE